MAATDNSHAATRWRGVRVSPRGTAGLTVEISGSVRILARSGCLRPSQLGDDAAGGQMGKPRHEVERPAAADNDVALDAIVAVLGAVDVDVGRELAQEPDRIGLVEDVDVVHDAQ